ncbi:MAG: hypothetical protein WBI20_14945 [Burkholderiaceae bacterium]
MNSIQAKLLLDSLKSGAIIPQWAINKALMLTGDLSETRLYAGFGGAGMDQAVHRKELVGRGQLGQGLVESGRYGH